MNDHPPLVQMPRQSGKGRVQGLHISFYTNMGRVHQEVVRIGVLTNVDNPSLVALGTSCRRYPVTHAELRDWHEYGLVPPWIQTAITSRRRRELNLSTTEYLCERHGGSQPNGSRLCERCQDDRTAEEYDELVARASAPPKPISLLTDSSLTLGSLLGEAKKAGVIKPVSGYGYSTN